MKHSTSAHWKVTALLTILTLVTSSLLLCTTTFAQAKKPITKEGLVEALRLKGLSTKDLVKQIETRGVSFEMNTEVETQLVTAGARPEIIRAVRENYRSALGTLNVTSTVAGTEITVSGQGSSMDRVTDMKLQPGHYDVVGKLRGYRTVTKQVEIKTGETSNLKLELESQSTEETTAEESAKPAKPASAHDASATEIAFWDSIKNSNDPDDLNLYIKKYPSGAFVELANARLERMGQEAKDQEQRETARRQAEETARISVAGTIWQGTSVGRDKQYAFAFDPGGTFRMTVVYWGIQSNTGGVWTQNGTALHLTMANPKDGEMVTTITGQRMDGEWNVPEKTKIHTYRFVLQRVK